MRREIVRDAAREIQIREIYDIYTVNTKVYYMDQGKSAIYFIKNPPIVD